MTSELSGGGYLIDLQGLESELEDLRDDLETYPYEGQLGVQGKGGQSSVKRSEVDEGLIGEMLQLMLATLPEGPWELQWWMNRTPETAAIGAHAHGGEWSGLLYVGLPEDPAPLQFVGLKNAPSGPFGLDSGHQPATDVAEDVEARVGRLVVWPANRLHQVVARDVPQGGRAGHRLALVFNAARPAPLVGE